MLIIPVVISRKPKIKTLIIPVVIFNLRFQKFQFSIFKIFEIVSYFFEAEFFDSVKTKMLGVLHTSPQTHSTSVYKHLQNPGAFLQVL